MSHAHSSYKIECTCPRKNADGRHRNYLGDIETSRPNIARHHCKNCNTTYEHEVTVEGQLIRRIIDKKISYHDEIVRIG